MMRKIIPLFILIPILGCTPQETFSKSFLYYANHHLSILDSDDSSSEGDKLFSYLSNKNPSLEDNKKWGEKFFLVFVQENCSSCDEAYEGFNYLETHFNKDEFITNNETFLLYTIFIDTVSKDESKNYFVDNIYPRYYSVFENAYDIMMQKDKAKNEQYKEALNDLLSIETFSTITTFLYQNHELKDVLFSMSQSSPKEKAFTLFESWKA